MKSFKTISQYIAQAPESSQERLHQIYKCIKSITPNAQEGIKWSMPAFSHKRILVIFAGFKKHIGFYPTPNAIIKFKKELSKYKTAKGSIQFPLDQKLPTTLIKKMVRFRIKESIEQDGKWKL